MSIALLIIYFFFLNSISINDYIKVIKTEKPILVIILCISLISFLATLKNYKYITKKIEK